MFCLDYLQCLQKWSLSRDFIIITSTLPVDTHWQNAVDVVSCDEHVAELAKMENTFQLAVENQAPSKTNQMPIKNKKNQKIKMQTKSKVMRIVLFRNRVDKRAQTILFDKQFE